MSESNCGCALALPSTCMWPGEKNVVDIFTGFFVDLRAGQDGRFSIENIVDLLFNAGGKTLMSVE